MLKKLVLVGLGSFAYGASVSWALVADAYELRMRRNQLALKSVIENQSATIIAQRDLLLQRDRTPVMVEDALDDGKDAASERRRDEEIARETPQETRKKLQNQIDTYLGSARNPEDRAEFDSQVQHFEETGFAKPFVISKAVFAFDPEEGDAYDKVSLTWYEREQLLIDEDNEVLDLEDFIGHQALNEFGHEDVNTVFVRNRKLQTDFEVYCELEESPPLLALAEEERETFARDKAAGVMKFPRGGAD